MIERSTARMPLPPRQPARTVRRLVWPNPYLPTRHRANLAGAVTS
jgi:hypothetical protein